MSQLPVQPNVQLLDRLRSFATVSAACAILVGGAALFGWACDVAGFKSIVPGWATMKPNTALCFFAIGVGLWTKSAPFAASRFDRFGQAGAGLASLLALLTLVEYLLGRDFGIDQFLFLDGQTPASDYPGRMAPATAAHCLGLSAALLLLDRRRRIWPAQVVVLLVWFSSMLALVGYLYGVDALYHFAPYSSVSIQTAVVSLVTSLGILAARPDRDLMSVVTSPLMGGRVGRKLLLVAICAPILVGYARLLGEKTGLYEPSFGVALFAMSNVVLFATVVYWSAAWLNQADATRNRALSSLEESERRYRMLATTVPVGIFHCDAGGKATYFNDRCTEILGLTVEQAAEHAWLGAIHPDERDRIATQWDLAVKAGADFAGECRLLVGKRITWISTAAKALRDDAGRQTGFIGTVTDVTARKEAEWQLLESYAQLKLQRQAALNLAQDADDARLRALRAEQKLRMQIERMPLGYLFFDADRRIADWNASAETIFGYRKDEILGDGPPYEKILPVAVRPHVETLWERLRAGDMTAHSINENLTKDGRSITCEWFNTPLLNGGGTLLGVISLVRDVTDRRRLEEQLRQSQKMEAIGRLAAGVAHDFNNLLTVIKCESQFVETGLPADSALADSVRAIAAAGERAAALTRQLLAFSRKQVLEPKVIDLNAEVADMAKMLERLLGEDVELRCDLDANLSRVKADPGQIEQVLVNLAVNARDAMPEGGRLTIETADIVLDETYTQGRLDVRPGRYVVVAMSDTGCGMDEATKAYIFEPFFTTKPPGTGTGLGLATVYGIVKQSEGHVAVYSEPGHGTTFKIYLPAVDEMVADSPAQPATSEPLAGSETILITEDEPTLRALARRILEMYGYHVLEAPDGEQALQIAEDYNGTIHLLATDVVMPGLSGRQLAERLTAVRPGIKVLYLSGYTDDAIVRHGVLQAQTAFLQKPFTPDTLAHKVREVLDCE